jgi:hypothetical protein
MSANERRARFQAMKRMSQVAIPHCRSSNHQRAVGNRFGYGFEFFGARQYVGCAHGGASAFKSHIVGIHYTQMLKSEIAHRPRGCADVEGIARVHQDDAQTIEFSSARQRTRILRQAECPASLLPYSLFTSP